MEKPYISFIVTGRNDDYGGNFINRMQISLNTITLFCKKYKIFSEIIIVEWNPVENKKKLSEIIQIIPSEYTKYRFIEVPSKIHLNFKNSNRIPLFEYIAKNTGIRRAKGKFLLVTNPDIIFNEYFFNFVSKKSLTENNFYRIDRYDLNRSVPTNTLLDAQQFFLEKNYYRVLKIDRVKYRHLKNQLLNYFKRFYFFCEIA